MTPEAIRTFQRTHTNHLGKALSVDGVAGPQTEWALDFETLCQGRQSIVVAAQGHLGLEEQPPASNSDPAGIIREWLTRCGAAPGDPWCASFLCYCLSAGLAQPLRIAGAQALGKRLPAVSDPLCGDIFWYPTDAVHGHCGLVIGTSPVEVMTIEGNCANAVRCVRRPRGGALRFARTIDDTSGTSPGVVPSVPLAPGATR